MPDWSISGKAPTRDACPCCGSLRVEVQRAVLFESGSRIEYRAQYTNAHVDQGVHVLVSIDRGSFYFVLTPTKSAFTLRLENGSTSPWSDSFPGLDRDAALGHPDKKLVFDLATHISRGDPSIRGFFHRIKCGDATAPLEISHGVPDAMLDVAEEDVEERVKLAQIFAILDGETHFLRALLQTKLSNVTELPVEVWAIGVWVKVSEADFKRVYDAWDDEATYGDISLTAQLANDLSDMDIASPVGTELTLAAVASDEPLRIVFANDEALYRRIEESWSELEFIDYAIARGYL